MKKYLLALLLCAAFPAFCSTRIDLDADWHFRTDPQSLGEASNWPAAMPGDTEVVQVPHTWSLGRTLHYEGYGWYFKSFSLPQGIRGDHLEVHFGATFYKSKVWLNGHLLGSHEGGYTAYYFDISKLAAKNNFIAVEIDNRPTAETIPGAPLKDSPQGRIYDWWPYGGMVRDVWITVSNPILIRWQHIDTALSGANAEIQDDILLENYSTAKSKIRVRLEAYRDSGNTVLASTTDDVQLVPGETRKTLALRLANPSLWDFDHPNLYRLRATLLDDRGNEINSTSDTFGVRTVEIHDRHLYLNGNRVRLTGLTRHEDSPWEGLAETRGTIVHDYDDMKALQETLTRPVHYPQNPIIYDYADRNGILMIPEIPMWQFNEAQMTNPKVQALARQMFQEMVDQNYNHPSIFAWSTDNESATDTPGGIQYFRMMYAFAKKLNPARFVSFADDRIAFVKDPATNASSFADFIMWNEYFGTWDGPESLLDPAFDLIEKGYPDKMVIVTEFGTPGVYAANDKAADVLRVQTIRKQLALFAKRDWIAGAILWCYQDYRSYHNLRVGQTDFSVDHGVVDKNRQRRPSYFVWQQENAPAHIGVRWEFDQKGTPVAFNATVARRSEDEIPSYKLVGYVLQWRILDQNNKVVAHGEKKLSDIGTPDTLTQSLSFPADTRTLKLQLELYHPTGLLAQSKQLVWQDPQFGGFDIGDEDDHLPDY